MDEEETVQIDRRPALLEGGKPPGASNLPTSEDCPTPELAIEAILDNFDWDSVKTAMTALKWEWYIPSEYGESAMRTPSFNELRSCAKRLLHKVSSSKRFPDRVATGGFVADAESPTCLSLQFILEEATSY